jgi:hypothetical protein
LTTPIPPTSTSSSRLLAAGAAGGWALACVRWFDDGARLRPVWLAALPAWVPAAVALAAALAWLWRERSAFGGDGLDRRARAALYAACALALLARWPLVRHATAGYLTSDGALSGLVALRVRDAREHFVFVPAVPYSGSLKSHLTAPLAAQFDPARAFALVSVLFFVLALAAAYRLAWRAGGRGAAHGAGLYLALAPAFVTQYSLSNDGNYVEVLALGPWALLLALRALEAPRAGPLALTAGVLLGLAFWCHILALIPALAVGLVLLAGLGRRGPRAGLALAAGFVCGYLPGLLWNAGHGWESLRYVIPGLQPVGEGERFGLGQRLAGLLFDHAPILMGDSGAGTLAPLSRALAWIAVALGAGALAFALRAAWRLWHADRVASRALGAVTLLAAVNVGVALFALPYLPGNPRYLVFLATPVAVTLGFAAARVGGGRLALAALVAFGALGALDQARLKIAADREWRALVRGLEGAGVRHCYSDFYLGTKVTFLSEERVICSAKLGPTTTEYFFEYRREVDAAPAAAYVATTWAQGDKLGRRLARLGVSYERLELTKPVLLPSRKVDPAELFPERDFPLR